MLTIEVNNRKIEAKSGEMLLDTLKRNGITVPTLCHMENLFPTGACRMCVVEVEGERALVPSCAYPVRDGMKVQTHSPRALRARKTIIELLLANHPDDCLYCVRSGHCDLQGLANELGRQLVETVGESLERNPRLTVQQFREGGSPARLARMRQWDRATGDPEVTDRIVDGLIGLGALPEATVKEIPMPPAPSLAPSVVSTEPETTAPAAQPAEASATPTSPTVEQYDSGLFERLRAWRLEAAQQQGQKAFYVFPDATLQRIAAARPQSLDDLQAVKGVGPKKLEQYGQAVLDITRQGAEDPQAKEQEV